MESENYTSKSQFHVVYTSCHHTAYIITESLKQRLACLSPYFLLEEFPCKLILIPHADRLLPQTISNKARTQANSIAIIEPLRTIKSGRDLCRTNNLCRMMFTAS